MANQALIDMKCGFCGAPVWMLSQRTWTGGLARTSTCWNCLMFQSMLARRAVDRRTEAT